MTAQTEYPGSNVNAFSQTALALNTARALQLPKFRKAMANAVTNNGRVRVANIGDSNTAGIDSGGTGTSRKNQSYPDYLANVLAKVMPIPITLSSFWGSVGPGVNIGGLTAYNPSVVVGANWQDGLNGSTDGLGGPTIYNNTSNTAISFTPPEVWDTVDVYNFNASAGTNTFTMDVGGVATPYTTANSVGVKTTYAPGSRAVQTAAFKRTAGSFVNLVAMDCYDSTTGHIAIYNLGHSGSKSADWIATDQAYRKGNLLPLVGMDLAFVNLFKNDFDQAIPTVTSAANLQTLVTRLLSYGTDVVLVVPAPPNTAGTPGGPTWSEYVAVIYSVAWANNLPVVDFTGRLINYANMSALGMVSNSLHPNKVGNFDCAMAISNFIRSVL